MSLVRDYFNKSMICDTDKADGNVRFDKETMTFKPRNYDLRQYEFTIRYEDITEIKQYKGIKSTVMLVTSNGTYTFHMYKMNTFIQQVESGREYWNAPDVIEAKVVEPAKPEVKRPLSDDDLEKLAKLAELHDQGVLNDAQFEEEKNIILNRH